VVQRKGVAGIGVSPEARLALKMRQISRSLATGMILQVRYLVYYALTHKRTMRNVSTSYSFKLNGKMFLLFFYTLGSRSTKVNFLGILLTFKETNREENQLIFLDRAYLL